uniref:Uncharacterized protein n=1 Tax=Chromera velia CCMP2878 TaxID=1169474 RepID=A0A0G4FW27_9ALVE|eukprot:Cvel_18984.t1-p1 / transcript=Cvel_18984.t1 / gene=Cvel_18984 / organism=Chromera_velia_CCMP2878 / gene_product=hypothetical protein / transcript_product=hypothetical protein / location=Cvel_scaffold1605:42271-42657(+) / protein_length=129 / sequence_SO=supercontig / SO=protein_coding / is_pseudo=false
MIQVQQTQQLQQQQMDALGAQQQQTATDGGPIHQQQQQTSEQQQQQRMNQQQTSPPPQWSNFKAKEPPVFHGDRKLLEGWVADMREYIQLCAEGIFRCRSSWGLCVNTSPDSSSNGMTRRRGPPLLLST